MYMKLKLSAALLILSAAAVFAGSKAEQSTGGTTGTASTAAAGNNLVIAMETRPNLDPHWNAGSTGSMIQEEIYEGLYRYTETGFTFAGAESVDKSADGLTWTFHLRKNAVWSDGKPVTAGDYVYSMRRLVNPALGTIYMKDYGQFLKNGLKIANKELPVDQLGVRAIDDYTLEIQLENVCSYFDAILCYTTFYPLRSDMVLEDGTGDWAWDVKRSVTNGPMKLVSCDEEQELVLEKSPTYWNAASVKLDRLTVKLLDDSNTRLALFRTGQVDLLFGFPSEEVGSLKKDGFYHTVPALGSGFLLVNTNKAPLSDSRVRRALSLALDRDYLNNVLFNGTRYAPTTYIGRGFPGSTSARDFYSESPVLVSYAPEEARSLLAAAGFPGGAGFPVLELSYGTSADNTTLFEYLQSVWEEELGITVTLSPLERAAMTSLRDEGRFDITNQGWGADYFDVSNMLSIFTPGNFINAGRYNSAAYADAYNKALTTVDNAERIALLHEAERLLVQEDAAIIPLWYSVNAFIFRDATVTGVKYNSNGKMMLDQVVVKR